MAGAVTPRLRAKIRSSRLASEVGSTPSHLAITRRSPSIVVRALTKVSGSRSPSLIAPTIIMEVQTVEATGGRLGFGTLSACLIA